ncbi:FkbM family methyltransferase [Mucilaginibacter sp. RB4R14]|uniref:FkbM family methyltransferase n=1 Tax=Mucilaginibacter aurantiaciroseus TaxID=2949308 RepID=UPI002091B0C8|nr:FkbM family methyltransferase [Mucilaginibacter aurantiaciroseus]MCO5937086.1 FkbM family methyltransferase [Mucilaginibacter aurantiaciroseus]
MQRTIQFVLNHPFTKGHRLISLARLFKWQLLSRLRKQPVVHQFTKNSKLWVWKGLTGATGNIYCGLHDFEDMAFLLHLLRPNDLFIDIGANIGSYTMLASAEAGAKTIAVEPIPQTFENLTKNITLNNIGNRVTALNIGMGSKKDVLKFTKIHDTGNHVATNGDAETIGVNVDTIDNILEGKTPLLLKIDVEGFETEVLNGAANTLTSPGLKAIIIELNGAGNNFGFDEDNIHKLLLSHGFKVVGYLPFQRVLADATRKTEHNTLYIKDEAFITDRLKSAGRFYVQGRPL